MTSPFEDGSSWLVSFLKPLQAETQAIFRASAVALRIDAKGDEL